MGPPNSMRGVWGKRYGPPSSLDTYKGGGRGNVPGPAFAHFKYAASAGISALSAGCGGMTLVERFGL